MTAQISILLLIGIMTITPVSAQNSGSSVDWTKVTIEGFGAGTTWAQIQARLGPGEREGVEWVWPTHDLHFARVGSTVYLEGQRLEYRGRVVAISLSQDDHHAGDPVSDLGRVAQVQQVFGSGIDEVEQSRIRWREPDSPKSRGTVLKTVYWSHHETGDITASDPMYEFKLSWNASNSPSAEKP